MRVINIREYVKEHNDILIDSKWNENYVETDDFTLQCIEEALEIGVRNIMSDDFLENDGEPIDHLLPTGFDKIGASVVGNVKMDDEGITDTLVLNMLQMYKRIGVNTSYDKAIMSDYDIGNFKVYILYSFAAKNKIKLLK